MTTKKPKILFVYDIEDENLWKDGLWAAVEELKKDFEVTKYNLKNSFYIKGHDYDFILGWGAFGSSVEQWMQNTNIQPIPKGLCIGGYATDPNPGIINYFNVLFVETEWSRKWLESFYDKANKTPIIHAFGVNTNIFHRLETGIEVNYPKIIDYITVGAFAYWKRQERICTKFGTKMAIGQVQKQNLTESIDIIGTLLLGHCGVSDEVLPENLAKWYNISKTCYIPADLFGGGERSVLEARSCGINVEVENDNPKLLELLSSPVWDHKYYAEQLKKGIMGALK